MMKITVFGTGYVGLVTAVGLANTGKNVTCIDRDSKKVDKINRGISPIYEPGLDELLQKNSSRILATTNSKEVIRSSDVIIIAVGTPFDGNRIDLSYIKQASTEIGEAIKDSDNYKVIVVKSTVIPETTENVVKPIVLKSSGKKEGDIGFAMNPEFLREGNAVEDFVNPDRIVLGVDSEKTETILRSVYDGFTDSTIKVTNPATAETIKYTANSFLALTISYANEIARICETIDGVDSEEVFEGVILDKRFSPIVDGSRITPKLSTYLRAGIGFGGSCFPKDVQAFHAFAMDKKVNSRLLGGLLEINESQLEHVYQIGKKHVKGDLQKIAVLGTAFKPHTDDIRESPGIKVAIMALDNQLDVVVHDYIALENTKQHFGDRVQYESDPMKAINDADLIFVTTIWDKYLDYSDDDYNQHMKKGAILVDTRSHFKNRNNQPWRVRIGVG